MLLNRIKDHTGSRFGRLTAVSNTMKRNSNGSYIWLFNCDCGNTTEREVGSLVYRSKRGVLSECSECSSTSLSSRKTTHGLSKTDEYITLSKMKDRCYNMMNKDWPSYGGRGIGIYEEWFNNPESFISYVGPKPSSTHSIDRIDNNKGYEPGNVRWATNTEQQLNQRMQRNNKSGYEGVHFETKMHPNKINSTDYFVAQGKVAGKTYKKSFSTKKYGYEEALRMAIEARQELKTEQ